MIRATLSSLWAHKGRMALTGMAVLLGVSFVVGTLVFRDTLVGTFEDTLLATAAGVDVEVRAVQDFSGQFSEDQGGGVSQDVVEQVAGIDGVRAVEGEVTGYAQLVIDGEPVGGQGPPTFGVNAPLEESLRDEALRAGRYPTEPGEVAVDAGTADSGGIEIGDTVSVLTSGPPTDQVVVGIFGFGEIDSLAGATFTMFDSETALDLYSIDGDFLSVAVGAEPDVAAEDLRDRIAESLGDGYDVRTGTEAALDTAAGISEGLGFFTTGLLVFAGVSLFVGSFIIANTFSIVIAQRTRELALLRAVGASKQQVLGSVLVEALVVGVVGSVAGVASGVAVAVGLGALLDSIGFPVPSGGLVVTAGPAVVGLLVGVVVTLVAALAPAVKATRIPPVAALAAAAAPPPPRIGPGRIVGGAVVSLVGGGLLVLGLFGEGGLAAVGGGAAVLLVGMALLATLVARPVLAVTGWPVARFLAIRGELARENALRNPRRTAATASALMIGLGLVSFASIFGASLTSSAEDVIDDVFRADYVVQAPFQGLAGLSPDVSTRIGALEDVAAVSPSKFTELGYGDSTQFVVGVDPTTIEQMLAFGDVEGSIRAMQGGGLGLRADVATDLGVEVGDELDVVLPRTGALTLPVRAVFDAETDISWMVDNDTVVAGNREALDWQIWVKLRDGVTTSEARPALDAVIADFPTATLLDQAEQKEQIADQVNQLLALLSGLLLFSVMIALFGIVNTLSLSVFERTRELGLLRAIGASRRQVRAMVRWEAVLISVLGAVLGLVVGVLFGWLIVQALADEGVSRFSLPVGQLVLGLVLAAVAGVLAAVFPARRAAKVDVLAAIATD